MAPLPGALGASVRSAARLKPTVTPPPAQNPHPPYPSPGASRGKGRRRRRGGRRSPGAASPTPFSPHGWAPPLPRTSETWEDRAGQRSGPWLSRQGPAPPPGALSRRHRPASRRPFSSSPGRRSHGSGAGRKPAVGGVAGAWVRSGAGRDAAGASGFRPRGKGRGQGCGGSVR